MRAGVLFANHLLWFLAMALIVSMSGLRSYLDPDSPAFILPLGFIEGMLRWLGGTVIPLSLFSNGQ